MYIFLNEVHMNLVTISNTYAHECTKTLDLASIFAIYMAESVQDYSGIQDFKTDFPLKVSLKMMN